MRTTIMAQDHLFLELKGLAREMSRPVTSLIHEALEGYLKAHRKKRKISFAAIGKSSSPVSIARDTDGVIRAAMKKKEEL